MHHRMVQIASEQFCLVDGCGHGSADGLVAQESVLQIHAQVHDAQNRSVDEDPFGLALRHRCVFLRHKRQVKLSIGKELEGLTRIQRRESGDSHFFQIGSTCVVVGIGSQKDLGSRSPSLQMKCARPTGFWPKGCSVLSTNSFGTTEAGC